MRSARRHPGRAPAAGTVAVTAVVVAATLACAAPARAQRGVQWSPDRSVRLINKDVGAERWAITVDDASGVVTGNVYRADGGPPQYVWCWPQTTSTDPVELRCAGSTGCDTWQDLGPISVDASFLDPPESCAAAPAATLPARPQSSRQRLAIGAAGETRSGLRVTPDERRTLISKDVGAERWAITYDQDSRTLSGNVFDRDGGDPQFLFCEQVAGSRFRCSAARGCACLPCAGSDWTPVGEVPLPAGFVVDRRCGGTTSPPPGLVASLTPSSSEDARSFGRAVALDGDVAAVAAPDSAVSVFERRSGAWLQVGRLSRPEPRAPGRDGDDSSGFAASIDVAGDTLVVADDGRARVYERGDGSWSAMTTITPRDTFNVWQARIAGDTIALLTGREDGLQRAVRIYTRSGDRWTESATIAAPGVAPFEFLRAIALSPDRLVVYVQASENAWHRELSRLVVYDRADHWRETADFAAPRDVATDEPALAIDGDTIAVGEPPPRSSDEANRGAGAVHLFTRSGSGWNATARFDTCAPDAGAFGASVDLDAGLLAVGSGPSRGGGAGDVHLFASTNGAWQPRGRIAAADADPTSVALSGGNLLAGTTSAPSAALFDVAATEPTPPAACPTVPEQWPIPDWRVEPPAAHGMNPVLLEQARSYAFQPGKHTQGVVIVRHGVIVAEWYEAGRDADSYAASWSMAKSVSSAVIGIALERGLVDGVDASLATFVPEWSGTDRARITLRNVLQMTSGLDWTEDYALQPQQLSDIARLASTERDQLAYVLARPLAHEPGSYWAYSSGDSMLLSAVIESATRRSMGDFAREVLFAPLGMQRAEWWSDAVGHTLSYCCVDAPTREFARFGLLYARGGRWGDDRLLSPEWVRDSTTTVRFADSIPFYGYQWWLAGDDLLARDAMFSARGWDGQYTYVFPNLDLVVVRSGHYDKDPGPPVADPTLFAHYPSVGLVPGRGTLPPEGGWDDARFLRPIVDAIVD